MAKTSSLIEKLERLRQRNENRIWLWLEFWILNEYEILWLGILALFISRVSSFIVAHNVEQNSRRRKNIRPETETLLIIYLDFDFSSECLDSAAFLSSFFPRLSNNLNLGGMECRLIGSQGDYWSFYHCESWWSNQIVALADDEWNLNRKILSSDFSDIIALRHLEWT